MDPKAQENFCPIPFLQLQLNPLGNVSACCYSGEYTVGSIQQESLAQIWNGERMRAWRREFIDGKPKICAGPMQTFRCHDNYRHLISQAVLSETQTGMPKRFDLRLNGQCNLECVMCDVWRQPNHLYDASDFWRDGPEKIFPHLLEIDMLGGEPFIQRDTFRLIDAVSAVNSHCTWGFITNGQYVFKERLRSALDKIKLRHIHVSLDSIVPETYAKIRRRGDLGKVMQTLEDLSEYREARLLREGREFVLFASFCVQRDNWRELPDFLDFCQERRFQPIVQNVIGRSHLGLDSLPVVEKQEISNFFQANRRHLSHTQSVLDLLKQTEIIEERGAIHAP